jgi:hypothetical protein
MSDKTKSKGKREEPAVEEQSSISELKSLGSTSSITIPRSSPLKKLIFPILALGVLGSGGFFFTSTDLGKSVLGSAPADDELVKDDSETNAPTPIAAETVPEVDPNGAPKEPTVPEALPAAAPLALTPVTVPVPAPAPPAPAKVEAPVKKATAVKAKSKKSKTAVTSKSKKSKIAASKSKVKSKKAVASKKVKAKKPAAQASVAPAHH